MRQKGIIGYNKWKCLCVGWKLTTGVPVDAARGQLRVSGVA